MDPLIERKIHIIRGKKVMLDSDLAELYGVETKNLNKAVKRNISRFPEDFMFQLTEEEVTSLKFQIGTSNDGIDDLRSQIATSSAKSAKNNGNSLRSQIVTSKVGRGGKRYLPYAFTEQGVAMLSSVLRSERAILVNIQIMRTFTKLRELLSSNKELRDKIEILESKYDSQFQVVFEVIEELTNPEVPPEEPKPRIGFRTD